MVAKLRLFEFFRIFAEFRQYLEKIQLSCHLFFCKIFTTARDKGQGTIKLQHLLKWWQNNSEFQKTTFFVQRLALFFIERSYEKNIFWSRNMLYE